MKRRAMPFLILLSIVVTFANALSPTQDQSAAQETQARGYWTDPATGLMWTAKDNGENINWRKSIKYCRDLQLAGYSDWRLPSVEELEGIYDGSGFNAPPPSKGGVWGLVGKPKGGLIMTGTRHWSSNRVSDDRGHASGFAWQFDFSHGDRWHEQLGYSSTLRAFCVRHP